MITKITRIKNFGIFQDYKHSTNLKEFNKFNLIYGWNGSGKSTLAKLFFSICDKKVHEHFEKNEFTISVKDQNDITEKNISENSLNMKVFNKDFIDRNVNFEESKANSIIILSEEKKEEMASYKVLLEDLITKERKYKADKEAYGKSVEDLKKNLSKWASGVKKSFELIETTNTYFLNYDRTKLNSFIKNKRADISEDSVLSDDSIRDLKNSIKPTKKENISPDTFVDLDKEKIVEVFFELEQTLSKSIASKQLERLIKHPEINQWVEQGKNIHENHKSQNCEYCGQVIQQSRIDELNEHFSDEYNKLIKLLNDLNTELLDIRKNIKLEIPELVEIYDEFHSQCSAEKKILGEKSEAIEKVIDLALKKLGEKKANPFQILHQQFEVIDQLILEYNTSNKSFRKLLSNHNDKNLKFDEEIRKAQTKLELHFVSDVLIAENYSETEEKIKKDGEALTILENEITNLTKKIALLEKELINEAVGAGEFNNRLAKFIGRKDISIEFSKELKGYKLIRSGKSGPAINLSEGEKTAIAFVYFISKLKENGNNIEETIIVVDDPISSFDSNHLFHSYSYLKQECEKSRQLIVLTHNFQYFKLVRDWMMGKNKKEWKDGQVQEKIKSHFYSLDCSIQPSRISTLNNANRTLVDFSSEYHYIFYKLHSFKQIAPLDLEKAFLIANLSRKLLEAFLTFKFPKGRNDFNQLMHAGCQDAEVREKVYRFINKYSHNQQIEFHDSSIDNLLGEGENIIENVFRIIYDLDKPHHDEMIEVCATHDT